MGCSNKNSLNECCLETDKKLGATVAHDYGIQMNYNVDGTVCYDVGLTFFFFVPFKNL